MCLALFVYVLAQSRHEGVCKKNHENSKKRKAFDSSKQRLDHIPIEVKKKIASSPSSKQQHTVSDRAEIRYKIMYLIRTAKIRLEEKT